MKPAAFVLALTFLALPAAASENGWLDSIRTRISNMLNVWEVALEFRYMEDALESYRKDTGR